MSAVPAECILIVDDEEANRDLLSRRLTRSGFTVQTVANGFAALERIEQESFDLVLLDQMMPGMSGSDLLRMLREMYTPSSLPVVMLTAVAEGNRISEALELGANDYIVKPVDYVVALARIRVLLSRRRAERALSRSEERFELAARSGNDGLWDWNLKTGEVYYSPRWRALLGLSEPSLTDCAPETWLVRVHASDREELTKRIDDHLANRTATLQATYRMRHMDGTYRWMSLRGLAVRSATGEVSRMVGSQSDITDSITADTLTGLPNRIMFNDRLERAIERVKADPTRRFAVMFLDLDKFKRINDSLGHQAGDKVLMETSKRLLASIRSTQPAIWSESDSVLVRMGGDEFAALLENLPAVEAAEGIAARMLRAMNANITLDGVDVRCSISIGISIGAAGHLDAEELIRDADTAMYAAKSRGRSCWAVFERSMHEAQRYRLQLENDLRVALQKRELEVFYQPRVRLATGRICGCEALVRWWHPTRGLVSPTEFIGLAEESGLIHDIGLFVLREACRQTAEWNRIFPQEEPLDVAVNLSVRQCYEPSLLRDIEDVLIATHLAPAQLTLELTESLLAEEPAQTQDTLVKLKSLGVGLNIDDFGTGFSSLKRLSDYPFDTLKIDRSFVGSLDEGKGSSDRIVHAIIRMAKSLQMGLVAEGIETIEQRLQLETMGCEEGQGYLYSQPVCAEELEKLLAQGGKWKRTEEPVSQTGKETN